ncbi:MAG: hypothetical protein F6K55_43670 [Moorea sp. SIO4A3]|nr:hypothetical protein [Moorena sp. SIO4A3]
MSNQHKRYAHATRTAISNQQSAISSQLSALSSQLSALSYQLSAISSPSVEACATLIEVPLTKG